VVDGMCIAQLGSDSKGVMAAYDLASGVEKWKWTDDGAAYASPVLATVDGAKAIVSETRRNIVAVSASDGKLLWETPFAVRYNAFTPMVDGHVLVFSGS